MGGGDGGDAVTGDRTIGPEHLEALRIHRQRTRDRLHQVPGNAMEAFHLAVIALGEDRRIPPDVLEAVRMHLSGVVYAAHFSGGAS